jgi:hypothetical protein
VTDPRGISIHEPDVVLTDLGLALLAAYLGWRLWTVPGKGSLASAGAVLLGALASAAFWGAIFHAFFPADTTTLPGFIAWIPVAVSIIVAGAIMLELGLRFLVPALPAPVRRSIVATYAAGFAGVVLLVDESFTSIVRFYVPPLMLFLVASGYQAVRGRNAGWARIAFGLIISVGAALLQQGKVSIHPLYFDHNAVYHVVQTVAIVFLYFGFRRAPETPTRRYATRKHPEPRPQ